MTPGLTTIVIPTYEYAAFVGDAVDCALAQTAPCEVIVVDDGSTDGTADVLARYGDRIRVIALPHGGPSAARNAGIDAADGEFLMLLDADDLIAPNKVEAQMVEMTEGIGWVLCDVQIDNEATGKTTTASLQYNYASKRISGWIQPLLIAKNFIPVMSPLVRRSVLGSNIRFRDDLVPEDWHFWVAVAGAARVRYVPQVLATYRHRRTGRSRLPKKARAVVPNVVLPLRLNLGCGTPDTRSWHPMRGMVNLDKSLGWSFEDGLGDFIERSVAGITVSHSLMYVAEKHWPHVFSEFARVLAPGGVVRVTEDDAINPASSRFGGWKGSQPAVTLIDAAMVRKYMEGAGLRVHDVDVDSTQFRDRSLLQAQHGTPPDVFFIEGVKQSAVLFSPHADDECLFASFSILRFRPLVVICYPSSGDYGETDVRHQESAGAVELLGGGPVVQWHGGDLVRQMREFDDTHKPTVVLAPSSLTSHPDHAEVAAAAREVFGERVIAFHTYDEHGKVRAGELVPFEPAWVEQKLRALCRYTSQSTHPRAFKFFMDDLYEYRE